MFSFVRRVSVSAHQQKPTVEAVLQAYQATPSTTEVVNSCPYVMPTAAGSFASVGEGMTESDRFQVKL